MKKKLVIIATILILLSIDLSGCIFETPKTLYVKSDGSKDYKSIQVAIYEANPGDTIYVYNGTYREFIKIDKPINLIGENNNGSIINGLSNLFDATIIVNSKLVKICGFKIENLNDSLNNGIVIFDVDNFIIIKGNFIVNFNEEGIKVNSDNNTIENNILTNNGIGIGLRNSHNSSITNNKIFESNQNGFYISNSCNNTISNCEINNSHSIGIELGSSCNNTIANCTFHDNSINFLFEFSSYNKVINCTSYNAYYVGFDFGPASDNLVSTCSIYKNKYGISLSGQNNTIENCIIHDNTDYGIKITSSKSSNNLFYNNDFINNSQNAWDICSNSWNNETRGNYWDDYNGSDSDGDGIGDTPYIIKIVNNTDKYPLMAPVNFKPKYL